jgi:hypothetical protein
VDSLKVHGVIVVIPSPRLVILLEIFGRMVLLLTSWAHIRKVNIMLDDVVAGEEPIGLLDLFASLALEDTLVTTRASELVTFFDGECRGGGRKVEFVHGEILLK